jgi:RNA polymerase sigma factor (TIGR02999 family)
MAELTVLLQAARSGDDSAVNKVFSILYDDLHRIAHARLRRNQPLTLLNTTGLVHDAYLRFLKADRLEVSDRPHFLAYAARVMRSIIVDAVRKRQAERHGGDAVHVTLNTAIGDSVQAQENEIARVGDAVADLAKLDNRLAQVVEMRYFAGLTEVDIAEALGVTERTVRRDWEKARALLFAALR